MQDQLKYLKSAIESSLEMGKKKMSSSMAMVQVRGGGLIVGTRLIIMYVTFVPTTMDSERCEVEAFIPYKCFRIANLIKKEIAFL